MFSHKNDSKKNVFPGTVLDSLFTISNWSSITDSFSATQYFRAGPRAPIKQGRFAHHVSEPEEPFERLNAGVCGSLPWLEADTLQAGAKGKNTLQQADAGTGTACSELNAGGNGSSSTSEGELSNFCFPFFYFPPMDFFKTAIKVRFSFCLDVNKNTKWVTVVILLFFFPPFPFPPSSIIAR